MVSITRFKYCLIKFDVHFVNDFPNKSKINRVSVGSSPEPPNTSRSLMVPKKQDGVGREAEIKASTRYFTNAWVMSRLV